MKIFFRKLSKKKKKIVKQIFADYYWISEEMMMHSKDVDKQKHIVERLSKLNLTTKQIRALYDEYLFDDFEVDIDENDISDYVHNYFDYVVKNNLKWIINNYDWVVKKHLSDPTYELDNARLYVRLA